MSNLSIKNLESLIVGKYPKAISKILGLDEKSQNKLEEIGKGVINTFNDEIDKHKQIRHVRPIIQSVKFLPKEDLAAMAESLVNLTSFKRKMSLGTAETVGGDIDVAVISKGDGFVWIKRKHYFKAELNPHFMSRY